MKRIIDLEALKQMVNHDPLSFGTFLQVLPGGNYIVNPTPDELKIIELYSEEMRKLLPPSGVSVQEVPTGNKS